MDLTIEDLKRDERDALALIRDLERHGQGMCRRPGVDVHVLLALLDKGLIRTSPNYWVLTAKGVVWASMLKGRD